MNREKRNAFNEIILCPVFTKLIGEAGIKFGGLTSEAVVWALALYKEKLDTDPTLRTTALPAFRRYHALMGQSA